MTKDENAKNNSKAVFKRWWFWAIITVVVISIGTGVNANNSGPTKTGEVSTNATAPSDTQNEEKSFKVGDIISHDNKEIIVKSVQRNFDSGSQFIKPDSNKEFIKVVVYIENKSDNKITYNTFDWSLQDSEGDIKNVDAMTYGVDNGLGSGELAKGGKKTGAMIFQVAQNDKNLILQYKPTFWIGETLEIKL
ncbi:MAG: DUF4352 domain-containing protein [Bifidobacteriaceae bacterium]|jgi:hypothetical protein|nr:DUF4352 domain-containing protein [Bifidobacteriaceae bacterium]